MKLLDPQRSDSKKEGSAQQNGSVTKETTVATSTTTNIYSSSPETKGALLEFASAFRKPRRVGGGGLIARRFSLIRRILMRAEMREGGQIPCADSVSLSSAAS
ncbi:Protein of unknown function [Gryllus bimaculatus]|nr:Protein of unknown function [Gryllus bimaculatus]